MASMINIFLDFYWQLCCDYPQVTDEEKASSKARAEKRTFFCVNNLVDIEYQLNLINKQKKNSFFFIPIQITY